MRISPLKLLMLKYLILKNLGPDKWDLIRIIDEKRWTKYLKAIQKTIEENPNVIFHVLDCGAGSCMLSLLAIDAGAATSTRIELLKPVAKVIQKIIDSNGYNDSIDVIQEKDLDEPINGLKNMLIIDVLDPGVFGDSSTGLMENGLMKALEKARTYTTDDCITIPESFQLSAILLHCPEQARNLSFPITNACGFNLSRFNQYSSSTYAKARISSLSHRKLSNTFQTHHFSMQQFLLDPTYSPFHEPLIIEVPIVSSGLCNAVAFTNNMSLGHGITISQEFGESDSFQAIQILSLDESHNFTAGDTAYIKVVHQKNGLIFQVEKWRENVDTCQSIPRIALETDSNQDIGQVSEDLETNTPSLMVCRWHFGMLHDTIRNNAYAQSIACAVKRMIEEKGNHTLVLDIGTGTGLLAMMAAKAGAKNIIACETIKALAITAEKIVEDNGYSKHIRIISSHSTKLHVSVEGEKSEYSIPKKVDLLVSEVIDVGLFGEHVLETIIHAKRELLSDDAVILPRGARVFAMAIECNQQSQPIHFPLKKKIMGKDYCAFNQFKPISYQQIYLAEMEYKQLSNIFEVLSIDFQNMNPDDESVLNKESSIQVSSVDRGCCNAIVFWFELYLDETIVLNNNPGSELNSWNQAIDFLQSPHEITQVDQKFSVKYRQTASSIKFSL